MEIKKYIEYLDMQKPYTVKEENFVVNFRDLPKVLTDNRSFLDYLVPKNLELLKLTFKHYFLTKLRILSSKKYNTKFLIMYEVDKPYLWSGIDISFLREIIYTKLHFKENVDNSIKKDIINIIVLHLEKELFLSLGINEKLSFNLILNEDKVRRIHTDQYVEFDKKSDYCIVQVEPIKKNNELIEEVSYSFIVLDQHRNESVEAQIELFKKALKNK